MESENKLVFVVERKAKKSEIKESLEINIVEPDEKSRKAALERLEEISFDASNQKYTWCRDCDDHRFNRCPLQSGLSIHGEYTDGNPGCWSDHGYILFIAASYWLYGLLRDHALGESPEGGISRS